MTKPWKSSCSHSCCGRVEVSGENYGYWCNADNLVTRKCPRASAVTLPGNGKQPKLQYAEIGLLIGFLVGLHVEVLIRFVVGFLGLLFGLLLGLH